MTVTINERKTARTAKAEGHIAKKSDPGQGAGCQYEGRQDARERESGRQRREGRTPMCMSAVDARIAFHERP